jgi:hypothetical protein
VLVLLALADAPPISENTTLTIGLVLGVTVIVFGGIVGVFRMIGAQDERVVRLMKEHEEKDEETFVRKDVLATQLGALHQSIKEVGDRVDLKASIDDVRRRLPRGKPGIDPT